MGDEELLRSVVNGFASALPQYLAAIRDTLAQQDREALRRSAHTLKGSAANVGAAALSDVAHQVEQAGQAGDFAAARSRLAKLEHQAALFADAAAAQGLVKDHAGGEPN
jgi:HPt (histidine-containing phosphotransfer) domain-containing protein